MPLQNPPAKPPPPVLEFALRALAWLVPAFALWHVLAPVQGWAVAALADIMVSAFRPQLAAEVSSRAGLVEFVTALRATPIGERTGVLVVEVNSRIHTAGFALYAALICAGLRRNELKRALGLLAAGFAALLPIQALGVSFDAVVQAAVKSAYPIAIQAGLSDGQREVAVLGYQAATLLGPTLAPMALWAIFCRAALQSLMQDSMPKQPAEIP
jgi:hypothetical protein